MHCRGSWTRSERWHEGDNAPGMMFEDLTVDLRARMPALRGRLLFNQSLAEFTWFRVGGAAQALFVPEDEPDLAYFLRTLPGNVPVTVVGLGSNLIVRDGGVPGIVIRLGRGFGDLKVEPGHRIRAGAAVPDLKVARTAQEAAIAGLAFLRGIPGAVGGALRMNGGAYGRETKDVVVEARGVDRHGGVHVFGNADMKYAYRHCGLSEDVIFTEARETTQPIKSRTGGSTFKNPPGHKAWQLIDAAGCRGLRLGKAQVSELHCNFLINLGGATAAEIEDLGEIVRRRVKQQSGIELDWEIKRIGVPTG